MVWFSDDVMTTDMVLSNYMGMLNNIPVGKHLAFQKDTPMGQAKKKNKELALTPTEQDYLKIQKQVGEILKPHFQPGGMVEKALELAVAELAPKNIMEWDSYQVLRSTFTMLNRGVFSPLVVVLFFDVVL